jgi:5-methylthioadenosine/S-adenosylhomocysteine deaminase
MKKKLFSGGKILTPLFCVEDADVLVEGTKISGIFSKGSAANFNDEECEKIDCSGFLIMPGLVNCHCHAPMTLLRGAGPGLPLERWLKEAIFPIEERLTPSDIEVGMTWGAMELLASGVTCVADMYDFPDNGAAALQKIGIKANLCRVGLSFSETEEIPPRRLDECVEFVLRQDADISGKILRDISIHSEYLTNEKFCRALAEANKNFRRPVHVHISETQKEHEECIARHGKTPIEYLRDTGLFDYGAYAAHCVYCTDDDFRIMREMNVTLVHNPSSNMKLGSGFARIPKAHSLGVNVALGTDGPASNDNLDMFEEMHLAGLIHKGVLKDPTVMPAKDVIAAATKNGATALGRQNTGVISSGKDADLCIVDMSAPHLTPAFDIPHLAVFSMHSSDVVMTVVDGEVLYDARNSRPWDKRFPTIDVASARKNME